jgi:penicillin amidase
MRIRDKEAEGGYRTEQIKIRLTKRGPVVSHIFPHLKTDKVLTLRYAPFENMKASVGVMETLNAKSAAEMRRGLKNVTQIMLNFVFADQEGHIGWQVSGVLPIRAPGTGTVPQAAADGTDNWLGWVPFEEMPCDTDPDKGWLGTCNHKIVTQDYPYYFSSHFASSWRYRRLKELLTSPKKTIAEDHWQYQRDTVNILAREIAPIMVRALNRNEETRLMAQVLSHWDYHDDPEQVGPMIFHSVFGRFARLTFADELGDDLADAFLENWYFWQERLLKMTVENRSEWFDNVLTPDTVESRDDLLCLAGMEARKMLEDRLGSDMEDWQWGCLHWIEFVHPLRRKGFGKGLLGGCMCPAPGSVDTLHRGIYDFNDPFHVTVSASLRMVADLGDDDKIMAVLPGGVTGRMFHAHQTDQLEAFINGEFVYWWFSDGAIQAHTRTEMLLTP